MFLLKNGGLVFAEGAVLEDEKGIRLETIRNSVTIHTYPADLLNGGKENRLVAKENMGPLAGYAIETQERSIETEVKQVSSGRYTISLPKGFLEGLKDARLQLAYHGDIGHAFLGNRMISDNFSNGAVWEIGLKDFAGELTEDCIVIYITPLKEGANVNVESAMAARREEAKAYIAELEQARVQPVYEIEMVS